MKKKENLSVKQQIVRLEKRNQIIKSVFRILRIILFCYVIYLLGIHYREMVKEQHIPICESDLVSVQECIPMQQYEILMEEAYTYQATAYAYVTIGDYKVILPKTTVEAVVQENTLIDTEIYVLRIKDNTGVSLFSFLKEELVFVRFSAFGGNVFSATEEKEYREFAATRFTYEKYKFFHFKEVNEYVISNPAELVHKQSWIKEI